MYISEFDSCPQLNLAHLPLNPASILTKNSSFNDKIYPFPEQASYGQ